MRALVVLLVLAASVLVAPSAGAAPPPNDAFAGATALADPTPGLAGNAAGSLEEATTEAREPAHGRAATASVWYAMTAKRTHRVSATIETDCWPDPSSAVSVVAVYTGERLGTLRLLRADAQILAWRAVAGQTYHLVVAGRPGGDGYCTDDSDPLSRFSIELEDASPPPNDDFRNATPIRLVDGKGAYDGELEPATRERGEPGPGSHSVWFRLRLARKSRVEIGTSGDERCEDPDVRIYTGSRLRDLREVAGYGPIAPVPGRTYSLRVSCGVAPDGYSLWLTAQRLRGVGLRVTSYGSRGVQPVYFNAETCAPADVRAAIVISRSTAKDWGVPQVLTLPLKRHIGPFRGPSCRGTEGFLRLTDAAKAAIREHGRVRVTLRIWVIGSRNQHDRVDVRVRIGGR